MNEWTDNQKRAMAAGVIGSVLGALLWKQHRVWGFILGGMLAGNAYGLVSPS
jgi:hypothetical protein